jgi:hypothetical protein
MKTIFMILILGTIVSCQYQRDNTKIDRVLYIDFQGGFKNDSTKIFINKEVVFDKVLRTNLILGFADDHIINNYNSKDEIRIEVSRSGKLYVLYLYEIDAKYVAVWFTSMNGLSYLAQNEMFTYE